MSKIPVFDIGDTLVPSRKFVEHVIENKLREINQKPVHTFDTEEYFMYSADSIEDYLEQYDLAGDPAEIARDCRRRYLEALDSLLILNNIYDLFEKCNQEFGTVGIISDNSIQAKEIILENMEDNGTAIQGVVVSEEAGVEKPASEIFDAFVQLRDRPAEDFVYFGNDASCDKGATEIGMDFVWVTEHNTVGSTYNGLQINELTFENIKEIMAEVETT